VALEAMLGEHGADLRLEEFDRLRIGLRPHWDCGGEGDQDGDGGTHHGVRSGQAGIEILHHLAEIHTSFRVLTSGGMSSLPFRVRIDPVLAKRQAALTSYPP
jgi:hypothetical protein